MKKLIYLEDAVNEIARWIGYLDKDMISRIQIGLERLPSAQPEIEERMSETEQNVPNDDFISRKGAIDALWGERKKLDSYMDECLKKGLFAFRSGIKAERNRIEEDIEIITRLPSAQPDIIRCEDCMHNGSFDTDCPIDWAGKDYCSFAERRTDEND